MGDLRTVSGLGAAQTLTVGRHWNIVILVGITLSSERLRVRAVGALLGLIIGVAWIVAAVVNPEPSPDPMTGLLVTVLAPPLGWAFAPMAASPGLGDAFLSAASITVIAVPLGALMVAAAMGSHSGLGLGEDIAGTLVIAIIGLVILGLPIALVTFVVASIWVGLLRVALIAAGMRSLRRTP